MVDKRSDQAYCGLVHTSVHPRHDAFRTLSGSFHVHLSQPEPQTSIDAIQAFLQRVATRASLGVSMQATPIFNLLNLSQPEPLSRVSMRSRLPRHVATRASLGVSMRSVLTSCTGRRKADASKRHRCEPTLSLGEKWGQQMLTPPYAQNTM